MQQLVAEVSRPIVLSDRALRELATVKRAGSAYSQRHGRDASIAELSRATGIRGNQIESLLAIDRPPRGLEEPLRAEEGATVTLVDVIEDPRAADELDRVLERFELERLAELASRLGEREREIVADHYGLDRPARTLREIGGRLELSAERVRQIEEHALEKLRATAA
jgi:DNA-directed RNA polymerase sigma subunit (sigma70/sigma32)